MDIGSRRGQRTDLAPGILPENFPELKPGEETREYIARMAGFGNDKTYRDARLVVQKGIPDLVAAMDRGRVPISRAARWTGFSAEKQAALVARLGTDGELEETDEWNTPPKIIGLARQLMGGIDIDSRQQR